MRRCAQTAWFALVLLAGCAQMKSSVREVVDDVGGLDPDEQREVVSTAKHVALAPGRHGVAGLYISGGAGGEPDFEGASGEIGVDYNAYWWSGQLGLSGFASAPAETFFFGPTLRVRLQAPTRLAPFVGIGGFAGLTDYDHAANNDNIDNDQDGFADEFLEKDDEIDGFFASVFPEVGAHLWLNDWLRLTASGSYHLSTEGRNHDFWMAGAGLTFYFPDRPAGDLVDVVD